MKRLLGLGFLALAVAAGFAAWRFAPELRAGLARLEALAASSGPTRPAGPPPGSREAPIPVEISPVTVGRVSHEIEAVGSLRSNESVILRPEISGRVTEILFEEGQPARRGAPLVRLNAAVARAQVNQAKASVALSRANHARAEELYAKGAGTQRARDESTAKLAADEASLALAEAILERSTIYAPFDGVLGLRQIAIGDYVNPGQALVNIESIDQLKVDFRIPEIHAQVLAVGQTIRVRLDAIPGRSFEGAVYAVDPAFDPNGRAAILRARLPNPETLLRPGMFARVTLIVEQRDDAILVPETALMAIGGDIFTYRVVEGRAVRTKLLTGLRRDGMVQVTQGLAPGEMIVTEGAQKLRDGQYVRGAEIRGS
ncbi:MAG: efflux RND transporter periplasmic adaptor subunit [Alphaproteobacteria bacterium]|nr:efflux RND transporter periplasmic adaptor subunit [Alphaproteobacteria bacterium]